MKVRLHRKLYKYVDTHNCMTYTEIKKRNNNRYYYRVKSVRNGIKIQKERRYLGVNLSEEKLNEKENQADKQLNVKKKPNEIIKLIPKIIEILKRNNIKKAGIFGSYARGDFKKNSDIDIIVQPAKGMGLEFVGLALELEDNLNKKIDLLTYKSIHPLIKKRVLEEEIRII